MRLTCPSCKTTFELPAKKARAGKKVRCARCATVFRVPKVEAHSPDEGPAPVDPAPAERTAYDDLKAAEAAEAATTGGEAPWGEPELDDGEPLAGGDLYAGPVAAPFEDGVASGGGSQAISSDLAGADEASEPAATPAALGGGAGADAAPAAAEAREAAAERDAGRGMDRGAVVGRSAIRAQSGVEAVAADPREEDAGGGWKLRLSDGSVRDFEAIDEVHAFLSTHPDPQAEVSSDGETWQGLAALRTMEAPKIPRPEPTGLSVALRAGVVAGPAEGAGPIWSLLALLSTVAMLASILVALQTLRLVDLSGWVPLEALGLSAIAQRPLPPAEGGEAEDPEVVRRRTYEKLMREAGRAREAGFLVDAAVAYRRASEVLESPEALEALAETYETLGEAPRARSVRERLAALRAKRGQRTP